MQFSIIFGVKDLHDSIVKFETLSTKELESKMRNFDGALYPIEKKYIIIIINSNIIKWFLIHEWLENKKKEMTKSGWQ